MLKNKTKKKSQQTNENAKKINIGMWSVLFALLAILCLITRFPSFSLSHVFSVHLAHLCIHNLLHPHEHWTSNKKKEYKRLAIRLHFYFSLKKNISYIYKCMNFYAYVPQISGCRSALETSETIAFIQHCAVFFYISFCRLFFISTLDLFTLFSSSNMNASMNEWRKIKWQRRSVPSTSTDEVNFVW